jgi:hypothetical protein
MHNELLAGFHAVLLSVSARHGDRCFILECDAEHFAAIALRQHGSIGKTVRFHHSWPLKPRIATLAHWISSPGGTGFRTGVSDTLVDAL